MYNHQKTGYKYVDKKVLKNIEAKFHIGFIDGNESAISGASFHVLFYNRTIKIYEVR